MRQWVGASASASASLCSHSLSLSLYHAAHTKNNQKTFFATIWHTKQLSAHTHTGRDRSVIYHTLCCHRYVCEYVCISRTQHAHTHQYRTVHIGERERVTTSNIKSVEGRGVEKAVIYCALSCCCSCSCCLSASVSLCVCVYVCASKKMKQQREWQRQRQRQRQNTE